MAFAEAEQIFASEEDRNWVEANRQSLIREFAGEFISVMKKKVIAHERNVANLLRTVREDGIDPRKTYIARMSIGRRV